MTRWHDIVLFAICSLGSLLWMTFVIMGDIEIVRIDPRDLIKRGRTERQGGQLSIAEDVEGGLSLPEE